MNKKGTNFREIDGILYHLEDHCPRIFVPYAKRKAVLQACHDNVLAGHLGQKVTLERVRAKFWWPKLRQEVANYVRSCDRCQRAKRPIRRLPGLLRPIQPPTQIGEFICMDIAGPLPNTSRKNRYIICAIDLLSKFIYARATPEANSDQVILFFTENILGVQGPPRYILTDNGTPFLSYKTQNVFRSQGCKLINSSPWNPQGHGIIERQFSTLKAALRAYLQDTAQGLWDIYLPTLVYALNSSYKEAIKTTPFELVYCKKPRSPLEAQMPRLARLKDPDRARQAVVMREQARLAILRAQKIYESRGNQKRQHVGYEIGDVVLLHKGMAPRGLSEKLFCSWRGPYIVLEVPSANTVKIALPEETEKAQIVHVQRVKRYFSRDPSAAEANGIAHPTTKKGKSEDGFPESKSEGEDDEEDWDSDDDDEEEDSDGDDNDDDDGDEGSEDGELSSEASHKEGFEQQGAGADEAGAEQHDEGGAEDAASDEVEVGSQFSGEEGERAERQNLEVEEERRTAGRGRGLSPAAPPYVTRYGRPIQPVDRYQAK